MVGENGGDSLIPDETWDLLESSNACYKGPTTTPGVTVAPRSVAVSIRQKYDLCANVRDMYNVKKLYA
jgi:isocitrate dehydrogenase (NAD+)